ncbi:MAG: metalloregulator ArsR/SmtB family transcription factor [Tepidisphaeraceae bacterium]
MRLSDRDKLARELKALADPMRLRILSLLPHEPVCDDVYNVSELAGELGITQPSVSHHLLLLKAAGLVKSRKMCRDVYYWIDAGAMSKVLHRTARLLDLSSSPLAPNP